jgi:hypothetical protein
LGSFASGFVDDPAFYAERYPHLSEAHRLREHQQQVDEGAFELGLQTLVDGLERQFKELVRSSRPTVTRARSR